MFGRVCVSRGCRVTRPTRGGCPFLLFFSSLPSPASRLPRASRPLPYNLLPPELPAPLFARRSRCTPLSFPSLSSPRSRSRELSPTSPSTPRRSSRYVACLPAHARPGRFSRAYIRESNTLTLSVSTLQCQPTKLTWDSTGAQSYNVIIVPNSDPCNGVL